MLVAFLWDERLFNVGRLVLVAVAIWSMAAVAISDDAQAGLGWLIAPLYGGIAMAVLILLQLVLMVLQLLGRSSRKRRSVGPRLGD